MRDQYFAQLPKEDLAGELVNKLDAFSALIDGNGTKSRWVRSYRLYFGKHFKDGMADGDSNILRGGKAGELALLPVNHYRNLIKHILVMATNQKPAFDVRAMNSDLKSLQQAKLGTNILDAYLREKRLIRYMKMAAEHALVFGKGFVKVTWEPSLGRPYTAEQLPDGSQRVIYEGDVEVQCPSPFDVFTDQSCEDFNKSQWVVVRSYRNKWDLAVRYPDLKDEIESLPTKEELDGKHGLTFQELDETADVPVYEFFHKRSDALPNGRYMLFCNGDTVLYDGPIPYENLPVFRITPGEIFGTTEGYSDAFDLMGVQDALNALFSAVFSNQNAFAIQNVLVPEGANISVDQLSDSLTVIKYNPQAGEPKALQLTATPAEVFKFMEILERTAETLSGVNSVARGNPDTSLKSGVALSLVQSMAIQFASGFQQSWAELNEDVGTFLLRLLRDFAKTERMVALAGKHNRGNMTAFKGDDLKGIDRVVVDLGNPLARTLAGRTEIANTLIQQGMIKTPQEYITVLETGNLEPLIEGVEADVFRIRGENEALMDGKPVQALATDSHVLDMQMHRTIVSDPDLRLRATMGDPQAVQVVQTTLAHIQEHIQLYKTQDPLMSMIAGEPAAPQSQVPPPPQGPPGPPPPMNAADSGGGIPPGGPMGQGPEPQSPPPAPNIPPQPGAPGLPGQM